MTMMRMAKTPQVSLLARFRLLGPSFGENVLNYKSKSHHHYKYELFYTYRY